VCKLGFFWHEWASLKREWNVLKVLYTVAVLQIAELKLFSMVLPTQTVKKINKILIIGLFTKKMTVTATKIDSSHESRKKFVTWAWPALTTIIYNNQSADKMRDF
jgi:hypothetical protein